MSVTFEAPPHSSQFWHKTSCCSQTQTSWGAELESLGDVPSYMPGDTKTHYYHTSRRPSNIVFSQCYLFLRSFWYKYRCSILIEYWLYSITHKDCICFPIAVVTVHLIVTTDSWRLEKILQTISLKKQTVLYLAPPTSAAQRYSGICLNQFVTKYQMLVSLSYKTKCNSFAFFLKFQHTVNPFSLNEYAVNSKTFN